MPLLFWAALGFGMLINALLVPILVIATLIALFVMDRDLSWLKRLRPLAGIPLALADRRSLAHRARPSGWHAILRNELARILGRTRRRAGYEAPRPAGNVRARALLGFLPGTALIGSAFTRLWDGREQKLARFLLAWVIGYLVYLEALSSKPGTYMVQTMFPALALAVASVVVARTATASRRNGMRSRLGRRAWPCCRSQYSRAVYAFAGEWPSPFSALIILLIVALFIWSGRQGREGGLRRWAATGVAALALFAITLLGGVLPSIDKIWPAEQLRARDCRLSGNQNRSRWFPRAVRSFRAWVFRPAGRRPTDWPQASPTIRRGSRSSKTAG